jgi:DNA-binding transcriptional regulator GbsR (MarR family)
MGSRWGVNRTVAQIYALLYVSPNPLTADEITETLSIARSTVSTGLRELRSWGIVEVVHVLGDRKDHFQSIANVWEMFRIVLDRRKSRELDPTLRVLRESIAELENNSEEDTHTKKKLTEMLEFFESVSALYQQIQKLPTSVIIRLTKSGNVVGKLLGPSV